MRGGDARRVARRRRRVARLRCSPLRRGGTRRLPPVAARPARALGRRPARRRVPEGAAAGGLRSPALYRRVRTRVAVQRSLAQRLERFAAAAEAIPEGIVVLDDANRIRFANARARSHLGLDPERDLGPGVRQSRAPARSDPLPRGRRLLRRRSSCASQREPGVTLSIQVVPYGDEQKLLLSRDITRIEATARMRREFIANVSHELKTPLTVVAGFVETLQDLDLDERQRRRYLALDARAGAQHAAPGRRSAHAVRARERAEPAGRRDVLRSRRCSPRSARRRAALSGGRHTIVAVMPADSEALVTGSPRRARERIRQPRVERRPLHARRRHDHAVVADRRRRPRPLRRRRHRRRHRAPSTFRGSPSASIASTAAARARRAERASGSRSSTTCCYGTRRSSRSRASPAAGARSPPSFRRDA